MLILLLACAPMRDTATATCQPLQDQGANLICVNTGRTLWACWEGNSCWYTDRDTVEVDVGNCNSAGSLGDAQNTLSDWCGGFGE